MMKRRHFLFGTSAGLLAQSPNDTIQVGMIGVGNRGAYVMRSVMAQPGGKVVAICDIKPDRLDKAATAAARDNPATYKDYRKLIEDKNVQVVHISTPCDLHVEMAIAALQAGKHVYCEKPVGIDGPSIARLVKVARESKQVFQVGQQLRSDVRLRKTIERVHQGLVGKVVMIKAQRHAGDDLPHDSSSADWFFDTKRSGDVIVEMSVHNLDVCNWVANSRPERAAGFGGALVWPNDPPGRTNMDGYTLSYEYANGVKMSYSQVFFHPRGLPGNGQYWYVYGTEGAVDLMTSTFYPRKSDAKPEVLFPEQKLDLNHAHFASLFDAIRKGTPVTAGIDVGATGALTAILGRDSIYKRRMLSWRELGVNL
jgi:predicted dehydrogenase